MAKTKSGSGIKALYEKHRGAERSNPPDGKYVVQFRSIKFDETVGKEKAFLTGVISRGELKGKPVMKSYILHDREIKSGDRKGQILSGEDDSIRMMEDFAVLGIDTEEVDYDDIPDTLRAEKPSASITIMNNGDFYNVRIKELIEDEDGDEDEDEDEVDEEEEEEEEEEKPQPKKSTKRGAKKPEPEPEEEEEESDDDEEGDDDDDDDEEEEDSPEPVKGGTCLAKPKGMKKQSVFKVKSVNKKAQTCDLVHEATGKEYKGIAWSEIEMDDEE